MLQTRRLGGGRFTCDAWVCQFMDELARGQGEGEKPQRRSGRPRGQVLQSFGLTEKDIEPAGGRSAGSVDALSGGES